MTKLQRKIWRGLLIMALLTPLGLLLPAEFKADQAWGEWGTDGLAKLIGYVPQGLLKLAGLWKAPVPDYNLGGSHASLTWQAISYLGAGLLGMLAVGLVMYLLLTPLNGISALTKLFLQKKAEIVSNLLRVIGKNEK